MRRQKSLTQAQLAQEVGVQTLAISSIENGHTRNPTADTIKGLSEALGCSVEYLLYGDQPTTSSPIHDHEPSMKERAIFALGKLTDDERRFVEEQYELVARNLGDSFIGPIVSFLEGKLRERRDQERDRPALPSRERVEEPSRLPPGSLRRADRKRRK